MATIFETLLFLAPLIILPAGLLLLIRPVGRLVFFIIGLIFFVGIEFGMELGGPDSPALILPFVGLCVSLAAVLAEGLTRMFRMASKLANKRRRRQS
jgi:hypothetical protein